MEGSEEKTGKSSLRLKKTPGIISSRLCRREAVVGYGDVLGVELVCNFLGALPG
jgi:hypothetical protein